SFNFFLETGFAHANYVGIDSNLIMACKEEGIIAYNTSERTYKRYIVSATELERNRFVMATKCGTTWWFAGDDGVYYLEEGSESLKRFEEVKKTAEVKAVNFIFTDVNGNVWFQPVH